MDFFCSPKTQIGEGLGEVYIVRKYKERKRWILWECFPESCKGPRLFWEKDGGQIESESYCQKTVLLFDSVTIEKP